MEIHEKELRLMALDLAIKDLDRIIETMETKEYPKEQIDEFYQKRLSVYEEISKVKKS